MVYFHAPPNETTVNDKRRAIYIPRGGADVSVATGAVFCKIFTENLAVWKLVFIFTAKI
jgi:hypothetical protein